MANHRPDGLHDYHCHALAGSIRRFISDRKRFTDGIDINDERWDRWAKRIQSGCAPLKEWEACRFIMSLPYTQPDYIYDTGECETFIFAMWVVNHTRFEVVEGKHPGNYSSHQAVVVYPQDQW